MTESSDCLFCQIGAGTIAADVVHRTAGAVVFRDLQPQAPVHLLVIPTRHLRDIVELVADEEARGAVLDAIGAVVAQLGLQQFRTVFNTGREGGQHVFHVHAHILAGRQFGWPPG